MHPIARRVFWAAVISVMVAASTPAESPPPGMAPVVIRLRPEVVVAFRTVTIGDIADLTGDNASLRRAISMLDIESPPSIHGSIQVTRSRLNLRIQLAGLPVDQVRVEGAEVVTLHSAQYQPPEADILEAASQAVRMNLPSADPADYQIRFAQPLAMQTMVAGTKDDVTLRAQLRSTGGSLVGRVQVIVNILANGEPQLSFPVYLDVKACPKVPIASRAIEKGEPLSQAGVVFERRPVDTLAGNILAPDVLIGKCARQAIAAGQVIRIGDTDLIANSAEKSLIKQGDPVKLVARLGSVMIVTKGIAQENGVYGKLIRVINSDSKRVVLGRVMEGNVVEVDP